MHVVVVGAGLVGRRCAAFLMNDAWDVGATATLIGWRSTQWPAPEVDRADVVVVATASADQPAIAETILAKGIDVVTTADDLYAVQQLWALGPVAEAAGARLVVGAAYSPGVSSLLVHRLVADLDEVSAISTAQFGTGGPACARQHHRAMGSSAYEVHDGQIRQTRGGTGRELVWFPDPIGAEDCYRAGIAEPWLLHKAFPTVERIVSRQAATRRDRLTTRLPMLRPPHAEGLIGAVWAEVRGRRDGKVRHVAMAATGSQATGAAAMAAAVCWGLGAEFAEGARTPGVGLGGVGIERGGIGRGGLPRLGSAAGGNAGGTGEAGIAGIAGEEVGGLGRGEGNRSGVLSVADCAEPSRLLAVVSKEIRLWAYDGSHVLTRSGVSGPQPVARKRRGRQKR